MQILLYYSYVNMTKNANFLNLNSKNKNRYKNKVILNEKN